jgi:hypothetical protein
MKYLMMIYRNDAASAALPPEAMQQMMARYNDVVTAMRDAGVYISGNPLKPATTATTVRVRAGKVQTTDGPFAETKEQLGGYFLLECKDLDEAIEWAARIPHAAECAVEVRPIMAMGAQAAG